MIIFSCKYTESGVLNSFFLRVTPPRNTKFGALVSVYLLGKYCMRSISCSACMCLQQRRAKALFLHQKKHRQVLCTARHVCLFKQVHTHCIQGMVYIIQKKEIELFCFMKSDTDGVTSLQLTKESCLRPYLNGSQ